MPELCRFDGIIVRMYGDDHNPPHFHAVYKNNDALITIDPIALNEGSIDRKALRKVLEWASQHQSELHENWYRLNHDLPHYKIAPP